MKRAGNLYPKIAEIENLELAFWKAQRGKTGKAEVRCFRKNLSKNLSSLRDELLSGRVRLGNYHYFTIRDPKERVICAADFRERLIQHAVVNICGPVFERYQIFDSYACRPGKGVDACLKRTQYFCRRFPWYLKMDIHKFFDSIHHETLLNLLNRRFKDLALMDFFAVLINTYEITPGCGIPIGNLLSQYFANLYLGMLDHQIKDDWRISGYVRYMYDFIAFAEQKGDALSLKRQIEEFLFKELRLELNPAQSNHTRHGIPFLSYRVKDYELRLSLKAKRRFRKKMTAANMAESQEHALSLRAFINRANSLGFRRKFFYGTSSDGSNRVNRGGSWNNNARNCRSANRNNNSPDNRNNNLGFRLALASAQGSDGCPIIEPDNVPVPASAGQNAPSLLSPVGMPEGDRRAFKQKTRTRK